MVSLSVLGAAAANQNCDESGMVAEVSGKLLCFFEQPAQTAELPI